MHDCINTGVGLLQRDVWQATATPLRTYLTVFDDRVVVLHSSLQL